MPNTAVTCTITVCVSFYRPSSYRNRLMSHRTSLLIFFIHTRRYNAIAVCLRVSVPVKTVSPAKADEPIEMPFGVWIRVCLTPKNHVQNGG